MPTLEELSRQFDEKLESYSAHVTELVVAARTDVCAAIMEQITHNHDLTGTTNIVIQPNLRKGLENHLRVYFGYDPCSSNEFNCDTIKHKPACKVTWDLRTSPKDPAQYRHLLSWDVTEPLLQKAYDHWCEQLLHAAAEKVIKSIGGTDQGRRTFVIKEEVVNPTMWRWEGRWARLAMDVYGKIKDFMPKMDFSWTLNDDGQTFTLAWELDLEEVIANTDRKRKRT